MTDTPEQQAEDAAKEAERVFRGECCWTCRYSWGATSKYPATVGCIPSASGASTVSVNHWCSTYQRRTDVR